MRYGGVVDGIVSYICATTMGVGGCIMSIGFVLVGRGVSIERGRDHWPFKGATVVLGGRVGVRLFLTRTLFTLLIDGTTEYLAH